VVERPFNADSQSIRRTAKKWKAAGGSAQEPGGRRGLPDRTTPEIATFVLGSVSVERLPEQRNLVLILARAFAAQLATAVFLLDPEGTIIYYNEAGERLTGRPFIEGGGQTIDEWMKRRRPRDEEGVEVSIQDLPLGTTMLKHDPAHGIITFRTEDGVDRRVETASFPLFAHTEDFVGTFSIVWPIEEDRP
jgi:PAS domain-containing protein